MPHAPCHRCGQLVLATRADVIGGGYHCDLCSTLAAHDAHRRGIARAVAGAVAAVGSTASLVVAGHPAAAASFAVGVALTAALWAASLPRRRSRATYSGLSAAGAASPRST